MSDLRREIEEIIEQNEVPSGIHNETYILVFDKSLATALEELFEKRIEPLRRVWEKYKWIDERDSTPQDFYFLTQAIKQVIEGGEK